MLKVLSSILCDLDPKVKVIGQKEGICDGVPSTSALVKYCTTIYERNGKNLFWSIKNSGVIRNKLKSHDVPSGSDITLCNKSINIYTVYRRNV